MKQTNCSFRPSLPIPANNGWLERLGLVGLSSIEAPLLAALITESPLLLVETFGTESDSKRDFAAELSREFDLCPQGIIDTLDLLRPIYYQTAAYYGHFGRTDVAFPWEVTVPESAEAHV